MGRYRAPDGLVRRYWGFGGTEGGSQQYGIADLVGRLGGLAETEGDDIAIPGGMPPLAGQAGGDQGPELGH